MDYNQNGIDAMQKGDFEKAAEAFTKAIDENSGDPVPYINFANLLSAVGELDRALKFYDRAAALDEKAGAAYYGAGNVYVMKERYQEAKDMFEKAHRTGMENSDLYYMLGTTLVKLEQPKLAMPYLQRAAELNDADVEARFHYAMCLANEGMLDEAITEFSNVTERDPSHADAFYNLGVAYAFKEDRKTALDMLNKALDIQPDHMLSIRAKQLLEEA
ncbi:tetratricopeptide repeat protein [Bacillus licheniformis]|uniref:tetratricopeptide repeat protein n=1 Tax=Bacillus licheniformis TaxID=1402 RepID=UPI0039821EE6